MEELNELLEQLHTLLDDYIELLDMDKDTSDVEYEIDSRIRALKIKTREQIEKSFDIPLILDGALLTFEKAIKRKRYLNDSDESIRDKVNIKTDGDREYYYYLEKEVYHYKFILGLSSKDISIKLNVPIKRIYSATERVIKKKKCNVVK